jgi:hypothetical protein
MVGVSGALMYMKCQCLETLHTSHDLFELKENYGVTSDAAAALAKV